MSKARYQRIRALLAKRQPDLTLFLEDVNKPHNVSALIRTADAVGVHQIHAVAKREQSLRKGTAMGSQIWVDTRFHANTRSAIDHLKQQKMQVLVTHLDDKSIDFRAVDYTKPTAIIMGQEKFGATDEAIALADQSIMIPMVGMVQSLNVSVAAATILYEAQRQRENAKMYDTARLPESEAQKILFEGGFPVLYKICVERRLPFPQINENGEISADPQWWNALQYST